MKLKEAQIKRLAEKVYNDLDSARMIVLRCDRGAAVEGIARAVLKEVAAEKNLDLEARRILDETLASMGRGALEIDRHKMLRMIREKLAKEGKIVL